MLAAPPGSSRIEVPEGAIDVTLVDRPPTLSERVLLAWVESAARAVAAYYGEFPVAQLSLTIRGGREGGISGGRTEGRRGRAQVSISVGDATTPEELRSNWVLVHEMVHLAFPSMTGHAWIEEGLATYVEPIIRARAGLIASDEIWKWLVWGLPRGLQSIGKDGLDGSRAWAATYWGGALFCFLADVEIRQRTENRKSLDDALRGIVRAGGNVTVSWDIERALDSGDRATGLPVLRELYARMGQQLPHADLDELFRKLGVRGTDKAVSYDDTAPLSAIRRGITTGK